MVLTKPHKNIKYDNVRLSMSRAFKDNCIKEPKHKEVYEILFNMATYKKFGLLPSLAFTEVVDSYSVFDEVFMDIPEYLDIYDIAITMYKVLVENTKVDISEILDMPSLDDELTENDFDSISTFELYKDSDIKISDDLLLFMDILDRVETTSIKPMTSISQLVRVANVCDYVMPDLKYKIASNGLKVKSLDITDENIKKLYVIQDSTVSMSAFKKKLFIIKSLVLDRCARSGIEVEWITAAERILDTEIYKDNYIPNEKVVFRGVNFKLSNILSKDKFIAAKVVVITDGTDALEKLFTPKTSDINILTFTESEVLTNKLKKHGKVFKV